MRVRTTAGLAAAAILARRQPLDPERRTAAVQPHRRVRDQPVRSGQCVRAAAAGRTPRPTTSWIRCWSRARPTRAAAITSATGRRGSSSLRDRIGLAGSVRPAFQSASDATNFAVAGARARDDGSNVNLPAQVDAFLQQSGGVAPADALYVIEMGGNDIRDALVAYLVGGPPAAADGADGRQFVDRTGHHDALRRGREAVSGLEGAERRLDAGDPAS